MSRDRWQTREEREATLAEIEAAGGVSAWVKSANSYEAKREQLERMKAFNKLAKRLGYRSPYPKLDED